MIENLYLFKYKYGHNLPTVHTDLQYQELNLIQAEILKGQEKPPVRGTYRNLSRRWGFNHFYLPGGRRDLNPWET